MRHKFTWCQTNILQCYWFSSAVTWRGEETLVLNDDLNSTCLTFNTTNLRRGTDHIIVTRGYDVSVDLWLSGWGLVCTLDTCTNQYPTQVFQQGRSPGLCVKDAPLCLGASLCSPVSGPLYSNGDWVTCQYRCDCPMPSSAAQPPCDKMVVLFGNGSVAVSRDTMELCDVSVTVI